MKLGKALINDELADAYKEHFGGTPRIYAMDDVFKRVAGLKDLYYVCPKEGTIHKILKPKENTMKENKMKIKRFYVEAKKSSNFQTYTAGLEIEVENQDKFEEELKRAQAFCRKAVQEQIKIDRGN